MAGRGEVDTSSPFESVKQAVDLFGGSGGVGCSAVHWRPRLPQFQLRPEEMELMKVEEQTVKIEMELFVKERETLKVLKELEATKHIIDALKSQLEKKSHETTKPMTVLPLPNNLEKSPVLLYNKYMENRPKSAGNTLIELQQAKAYLNRNTIETLKNKIEEEKLSMERTREKIRSKTAIAISLEQNLSKAVSERQILKTSKPVLLQGSADVMEKIKQMSSERDENKKIAQDCKTEISQLIAEIERTKSRTRTVEVRLLMARKMKEASNSAERLAHSEIKSLIDKQKLTVVGNSEYVTLSIEEHAKLTSKAQEAEEVSRSKIEDAMKELEEANKSKQELLERVEEAMADVLTSRKALDDALEREKAVDSKKLEAEEALRRWRSERTSMSQSKRFIHSSTKFKNSVSGGTRKEKTGILDVNGLSLMTSGPKTLSIGQILSKKLMSNEEYERRNKKGRGNGKQKVSLGQILSQSCEVYSPLKIDDGTCQKQYPSKRKRLGFVVLTLFLAKQRRKKKQGFNTQSSFSGRVV